MSFNLSDYKIAFIGTAPVAADLLQTLIESGVVFEYVITQPDRKKGRKGKTIATAVKETALKNGLRVEQPEKINAFFEEMKKEPLDLIVTCAYGQFLKKDLLDYPKYGCVNLHGSLLPKYRGGAPVQRAIWNGDATTGVSLMLMDPGMDSGPVLDQCEFEISGLNNEQVFSKMSKEAAGLLMKHLETILKGEAKYVAQDEALVSFAPVISAKEEVLDLSQSDQKILSQVLALSPEPGAYIRINGKKLKIFDADYEEGNFQPLGVFAVDGKKAASIGLNEGRLNLKTVQLEGKPKMEIASFVQGAGRTMNLKKAEFNGIKE